MKQYHYLYSIAILATLALVVWLFMMVQPRQRTLATYVARGVVSPAAAVQLSFKNDGTVIVITKKDGDEVAAGDLIAEQRHDHIQLMLNNARKSVEADEALIATTTAALQKALATASSTYSILADDQFKTILQQSYSDIEDVIFNKTDQIFINPKSDKPQIAFPADAATKISIESGRVEISNRLAVLAPAMNVLASSTNPLTVSETLKKDAAEINLYLDTITTTFTGLTPNYGLSSSTLAVWNSDIALAHKKITNTITKLVAAEAIYKGPAATTSLVFKPSQNLQTELDRLQQKKLSNQRKVSQYTAALADTYLYAPLSGYIASIAVNEQQYVAARQPVAAITTSALYQIQLSIPKEMVGAVVVGSAADVKIPAIAKTYRSVVAALNPDPQSVSMYKATIQLLEADTLIKPGVTAEITMHLK